MGGRRGTPEERFWRAVDRTDECWLWTAATSPHGYGLFHPDGVRIVRAHRFAYELLRGPIPAGLEVDHLCRVPGCVNPDHLEPVTPAENRRRQGLAVTRCIHGHDYTPDNTYVDPRGYRMCRTCKRAADRRSRAAS